VPAPSSLDRTRIEAALPRELREALPALAEALDAEPDRWHHHPALRDFLAFIAAAQEQKREYRRGHSLTQALRLACGRLGLGFEAVERRLRRARKAYLEAGELRTKCPPRAPEDGASSEHEPMETR